MTIHDFLRARIAEDLAVADAAQLRRPGFEARPWVFDGSPWITGGVSIYDEGGHSVEDAQHIVNWQPIRAIAECRAKLTLVELHKPKFDEDAPDVCGVCHDYLHHDAQFHPCDVLKVLARVYRAHIDYNLAWSV